MTRLVVIGIDGMDPLVYERFQSQLPHLRSIAESGHFKHCKSVFPPDSIPAWVTIFTGEHPSRHGWLDNIDYEDMRKGKTAYSVQDLQGNTFWDELGKKGKRVCVINPLLAYPVWPVNGIMISGPVFISGEKQTYPKELGQKYVLPELGGMTDFPSENQLDSFLEQALQSTEQLAEFGLEILQSEPWDMYFISFFTLDRIQHFMWRFSDPTDPLYPGPSSLDQAVPRAYKCFDEIIGKFLRQMDERTRLLVISDHGHGQRPTMFLNLNEWLRQEGFLKTVQGEKQFSQLKKLVEISKNTSIRLISGSLGERWLYRIGRMLPSKTRKSLKKSDYLMDKENSLAWASEMGGGASVGGIAINPKIPTASQEYKNVVERILTHIEGVNRLASEPVIRWVRPREPESCYPDIIFELDPKFAIGRSLFCPLIEKNPRHRVISGGHKNEGVLFCKWPDLNMEIDSVNDIYQAITTLGLS